MKPEPGAVYVSCNPEEGPVARYGVRGVSIGAKRDPNDPRRIIFDEKVVVMIPASEFEKYGTEYRRAIGNKSLRERKFEDYREWLAAEEEAEKKRSDERKAEKEKKAADVKAAVEAEAKAAAVEDPKDRSSK